VLANTFFSHFVHRALCRAGRFDLVLALVRARYGPMLARGATTLWESYDPTASLCHGFSATPVYQLSTEALGVFPLAAGWTRFRLCPQAGDLEWVDGVFPTVRGDVRVRWQRAGTVLDVEVTVPDGSRAELMPAGHGQLGPGTHRLQVPV
jgi:alpha-L-rhamnosidase